MWSCGIEALACHKCMYTFLAKHDGEESLPNFAAPCTLLFASLVQTYTKPGNASTAQMIHDSRTRKRAFVHHYVGEGTVPGAS